MASNIKLNCIHYIQSYIPVNNHLKTNSFSSHYAWHLNGSAKTPLTAHILNKTLVSKRNQKPVTNFSTFFSRGSAELLQTDYRFRMQTVYTSIEVEQNSRRNSRMSRNRKLLVLVESSFIRWSSFTGTSE